MTFREQVLWARNSEEALLACGYAVAEATQKLRSIEWPEPTTLGLLLNRLRGQREGPSNVLAMYCLGFLKADVQCLDIADLFGANLSVSQLAHVRAYFTVLGSANLQSADLRGADLEGAVGLTQEQLDMASGDDRTALPEGLTAEGLTAGVLVGGDAGEPDNSE
jgi:hypothetical protein